MFCAYNLALILIFAILEHRLIQHLDELWAVLSIYLKRKASHKILRLNVYVSLKNSDTQLHME